MEQRNCKNCGAPLEHSYNHKCPYCNTLYDFNEPIEKTIQVKPEDLINIKLRNIEITPIRDSFILIFDGYKCEMPKVYEYDENANLYVSKVEEYINPPKCGFCIELSRSEIKKYGVSYIRHMIYASGIRINEYENVINQVLEKIQNYCYI